MFWYNKAFANEFDCPQKIKVSQRIIEVPAFWNAPDQLREHKLKATGFSSGPPEERAFLKPFNIKETGKKRTIIWRFEGSISEGIWLFCNYNDTTMSISHRLNDNIKECRVMYEKESQGALLLKSIECK